MTVPSPCVFRAPSALASTRLCEAPSLSQYSSHSNAYQLPSCIISTLALSPFSVLSPCPLSPSTLSFPCLISPLCPISLLRPSYLPFLQCINPPLPLVTLSLTLSPLSAVGFPPCPLPRQCRLTPFFSLSLLIPLSPICPSLLSSLSDLPAFPCPLSSCRGGFSPPCFNSRVCPPLPLRFIFLAVTVPYQVIQAAPHSSTSTCLSQRHHSASPHLRCSANPGGPLSSLSLSPHPAGALSSLSLSPRPTLSPFNAPLSLPLPPSLPLCPFTSPCVMSPFYVLCHPSLSYLPTLSYLPSLSSLFSQS
ncbi:unnamed protein product [Closterium sp. NIES-65]|nr:unnamed protein product [Closterium sp. NIES-65]